MLRANLGSAKVDFADDSGKVFDFHAFRHQYISNLAATGFTQGRTAARPTVNDYP
jgi:hypothetical protein